MELIVCPECGKKMDSIENKSSRWLDWSEDSECYVWNDPWDPGSFYCDDCGALIADSDVREAISAANG